MTILIADDNSLMREMIRSLVSGRSRTILECTNGISAVEEFRKHHPDVVVMDVHMDGGNGITATRFIKSEDPHTTVIVVTHYIDRWTREAAEKAGADAFVSKEELLTLPHIIHTLA